MTITSCIYHLVYWSYFNLNGLLLISITDVIKSSIYPLIWSAFFLLILNFSASFIYHKTIEPQINSPKKNHRIFILILTDISILLIIVVCIQNPEIRIILLPAYSTGLFYGLCNLFSDKIFDKSFSTLVSKRAILITFCTMPLISIYTGYHDSLKILNNQEYAYSVIIAKAINSQNDTIKLIGISENSFVFTSMKNDKVFFIKKDSIQLQFKK